MKKLLFIGLMIFVLTGMAYAAGPDPWNAPEAIAHRAMTKSTEPGVAAGYGYGYCAGCSGWVWFHAREAWRWINGTQENVWVYIQENSNYYADVDAYDAKHIMFISAAASNHWLGLYWTDSYDFSNVRLYYY
jgi:hypothetical protein